MSWMDKFRIKMDIREWPMSKAAQRILNDAEPQATGPAMDRIRNLIHSQIYDQVQEQVDEQLREELRE